MAENKNVFGKILLAGAGIVVAAGAAATAGILAGLKNWADDEDSQDIKIVFGEKALKIAKGEKKGEYSIDTHYDWQNDPDFIEEIEEDEEDCVPVVEVVTEEPCCCEEEGACCCEEAEGECECKCDCAEGEAQA